MIEWKDNSKHPLTVDIEKLLPFANRPISSLTDNKRESILVFPSSFQECKDSVGMQHLFDLLPEGKKFIVKTGNLAGFIGMNGLHIIIRSRFGEDGNEDFFLHYMLKKTLSINLFNLRHTTTNEQVFDFLLHLFPHYLNKALAQGVYKEYIRHKYNDCHLKGAIDINRHVKCNIPFNGRIAYRTREFSHDNHLTQLIRHTIEYIRTRQTGDTLLHNHADTQDNVSRIVLATPTYQKQDRLQVIKNNLRPIIHPYFNQYIPLQKLCLRILFHEQLKYGLGKNEIYGILFDVSWLWEEYLSTLLTPLGFKHSNNKQNTGGIWLGYSETNNKKNNVFLRYPDFYDSHSGSFVVDAKYKSQIDHIADINQAIAYLYRLKGHIGMFIQPKIGANNEKSYSLRGYGADDKACIIEYQFHIPKGISRYDDFEKEIRFSEIALKERIKILQFYHKNSQTAKVRPICDSMHTPLSPR